MRLCQDSKLHAVSLVYSKSLRVALGLRVQAFPGSFPGCPRQPWTWICREAMYYKNRFCACKLIAAQTTMAMPVRFSFNVTLRTCILRMTEACTVTTLLVELLIDASCSAASTVMPLLAGRDVRIHFAFVESLLPAQYLYNFNLS